jgi:acyl-CoA synthetase (NDP forming)
VRITTTDAWHWTRAFLTGLIAFKYPGRIYLINRRGGEIEGIHVYQDINGISDTIDYVIGLTPADSTPELVRQAVAEGAKAIHSCHKLDF